VDIQVAAHTAAAALASALVTYGPLAVAAAARVRAAQDALARAPCQLLGPALGGRPPTALDGFEQAASAQTAAFADVTEAAAAALANLLLEAGDTEGDREAERERILAAIPAPPSPPPPTPPPLPPPPHGSIVTVLRRRFSGPSPPSTPLPATPAPSAAADSGSSTGPPASPRTPSILRRISNTFSCSATYLEDVEGPR
jgi:hypothetical protein